ncbi:uncharacterized protein LOC126745574 [Anthonomus grandis grandis]|uniref:uncharacterized protein LOC126745574 n=1 Tax=Anthonomus grandis grandis TaxID=2921223 RepID=UPI002165B08C|nr:uncharacterized protein LOC126745574 [Anthonomus grandis grandis]
MRRNVPVLQLLLLAAFSASHPIHNPYGYYYPVAYTGSVSYADSNYGYGSYAPQIRTYSPNAPSYNSELVYDYARDLGYSVFSEEQPTLNVMAELPYSVSNQFSVVPMYVVSKNTMKMVSNGHITSVSKNEPKMTVTAGDQSFQCTPAVRMVLEKPLIINSLKSNILFPSEVQIVHENARIPIKIGAVIAPVLPDTYVSEETPISVKIVYAVPTKPIKITITIEEAKGDKTEKPLAPNLEERFPDVSIKPESTPKPTQKPDDANTGPFGALKPQPDYVNNADAQIAVEQEAVVVESEAELPPKNVTVIDFPQQEAEPHLEQIDEDDDELVNRNPPLVLAPAGIVQSTQPEAHVEPFHNDKESSYLETLREQAKKKKI